MVLDQRNTVSIYFDDLLTNMKKVLFGTKFVKIEPFRVNFGPVIAPNSKLEC